MGIRINHQPINGKAFEGIKREWDALNKGARQFQVPIIGGTTAQEAADALAYGLRLSTNGLETIIELWCGLNPFYILPDSPMGTVEIMAHRKVLKHIKKREQHWKPSLVMGIRHIRYIPVSHHKLRIFKNNGLGHADLKGNSFN